jgi:hypothetical protein
MSGMVFRESGNDGLIVEELLTDLEKMFYKVFLMKKSASLKFLI